MSFDILAALDASVARNNLLKHPFYQAWSAGTLPQSALADYARDWASFIRVIDRGWETVGQTAYAQDEREHAVAWEQFAAALGTAGTDSPNLTPMVQLRATAERLFAEPATALGALYAFEAQQPGTSVSKRDGLAAHYTFPAEASHYFDLHADDYTEAAWVKGAINSLDEVDQRRASIACERMCLALWDALSGIDCDARASA